jgi:hypothetical protein
MRHYRVLIVVAGFLLAGCSSMKPESFADAEPRLVLEEYFAGRTRAWGIFEDRFGTLRRQFVVDINGTWDGRELVLEEDFRYDDGETDRRVWRIVRNDEHHYEGRAADVVGTATGIAYGNALNWRYTLDLKAGERTWRVDFDDWMFLQSDDVLINRARVRKWGVTVGEVTIVFARTWPGKEAAATGFSEPRRMAAVR